MNREAKDINSAAILRKPNTDNHQFKGIINSIKIYCSTQEEDKVRVFKGKSIIHRKIKFFRELSNYFIVKIVGRIVPTIYELEYSCGFYSARIEEGE